MIVEEIKELDCRIEHLFISEEHIYVGHHGRPPGTQPMKATDRIECVAGQGIVGDRYYGHKENYKGQITFFEMEVYDRLCRELDLTTKPPSVFRRNVLTRGVDLNAWIGRRFRIQGVLFEGSEECRPCYWMDQAFGSGAEAALKNHGGLRARILNSGTLQADASMARHED